MKLPKWHQEIDRFKSFKTTFILDGNVFDLHSYPNHLEDGSVRYDLLNLDLYLFKYLQSQGYEMIIYYNHIDGFHNVFDPEQLAQFLNSLDIKQTKASTHYQATLHKATEHIRDMLEKREMPTAIVMNLASNYVLSPDDLSEEEMQSYSRLFLSTLKPTQMKKEDKLLQNLMFMVPSKTNDVPAWFYLDNPYVKTVHLGMPDKETRRRFIDTQISFFPNSEHLSEEELDKYKETFVDLTDGMKNIELTGLRRLCTEADIPINQISDAITLFKYGIKDNPWSDIDEDKLSHAKEYIESRLKGQNEAVTQTLDIIKRAVSGMSGLQHSSSSSKPKGILFFAGPTGTGKTELAKTLSALLFGDESACIRFDMSEFQQSHSDQKLLGAPPGYVGYEGGGQLTNAIKERPFSILLFDEIEKAHPSILDKFLQILEDGRMTDGQGETVYFSESIIIFTSNLGIYQMDETGKRVPHVTIDMGYKEIEDKIIGGIKEYFTSDLGRPEILNRIGNNIVVFDFIREEVAELILQGQLEKVIETMKETKQLALTISSDVKEKLLEKSLGNLENGGRGIGNIVEKYFINPLARFLFDERVRTQATITITSLEEVGNVVALRGEVRPLED